jgi:hypothetical protein
LNYNKEWWEEYRRMEVEYILELTGRKNSDYTGGDGCENPFANFDDSVEFGVDPLVGICIRMQDKFQRAKAFCSDGSLKVNAEGDQAKDIFRDLIGYSLIALGMLERPR